MRGDIVQTTHYLSLNPLEAASRVACTAGYPVRQHRVKPSGTGVTKATIIQVAMWVLWGIWSFSGVPHVEDSTT